MERQQPYAVVACTTSRAIKAASFLVAPSSKMATEALSSLRCARVKETGFSVLSVNDKPPADVPP